MAAPRWSWPPRPRLGGLVVAFPRLAKHREGRALGPASALLVWLCLGVPVSRSYWLLSKQHVKRICSIILPDKSDMSTTCIFVLLTAKSKT